MRLGYWILVGTLRIGHLLLCQARVVDSLAQSLHMCGFELRAGVVKVSNRLTGGIPKDKVVLRQKTGDVECREIITFVFVDFAVRPFLDTL